MDFNAAAREVLEEVGHPLHYTDITEVALQSGYLRSAGRTPQHNAGEALRGRQGQSRYAIRADRARRLRVEGSILKRFAEKVCALCPNRGNRYQASGRARTEIRHHREELRLLQAHSM